LPGFSNMDITSLSELFMNGRSGNIKNIIQYLDKHLKGGKKRELQDDMISPAEITKLINDTLYFPNYYFGPGGTVVESPEADIKTYKTNTSYYTKLLKSYPYPSAFISRDELNEKILHSKSDFYYLNYIQSAADKIISVINGHTGELIYTYTTPKSNKVKEKDFQMIVEEVKK
jgi:hypothetical protein